MTWRRKPKHEAERDYSVRFFVDGSMTDGWWVRSEGFAAQDWRWSLNPPYKVEFIVHALSGMYLVP